MVAGGSHPWENIVSLSGVSSCSVSMVIHRSTSSTHVFRALVCRQDSVYSTVLHCTELSARRPTQSLVRIESKHLGVRRLCVGTPDGRTLMKTYYECVSVIVIVRYVGCMLE